MASFKADFGRFRMKNKCFDKRRNVLIPVAAVGHADDNKLAYNFEMLKSLTNLSQTSSYQLTCSKIRIVAFGPLGFCLQSKQNKLHCDFKKTDRWQTVFDNSYTSHFKEY